MKYISLVLLSVSMFSCAEFNALLTEEGSTCLSEIKYAKKEDIKDSEILGVRSRESILSRFNDNNLKGRIFRVYNKALRKDQKLQGEVVYSVNINGYGVVDKIELLYTDIDNCNLINKVLLIIKDIKFEPLDDKYLDSVSVVLYPIYFKAS